MKIREELEKREKQTLSVFASKSSESKGRERKEPQCDIRPVYQRDRDRILYSKSFRRLKDKTQVFLTPNGDHYRTRMTHSLEVAQNARTIARALKLNEDLVEAIALGHDLGHTPFGHAGERALNEICPFGFRHNEQSLRIVEKLEKEGRGLNLTVEVKDGILNHELELMPATLEGRIVRLSDKIAYIHHDFDDAIRGGILTMEDLPSEIVKVLGRTKEDWLDTIIHSIVEKSTGKNDITMESTVWDSFMELRKYMFRAVYTNAVAKSEEGKAQDMVKTLYEYFLGHIDLVPEHMKQMIENGEPKERITCDYISGYEKLFIPKSWNVY